MTNRRTKYIVGALILTRIAQALVISILRNQTFVASCAILGLQSILAIYMTISRPYTKTIYNLVNILGEWTVTAFLSINLVINLQSVTSIDT